MKNGMLRFFLILFCCSNLAYAYTQTDLNTHTQALINASDASQNLNKTELAVLVPVAKGRQEFLKQHVSNPSLFIKSLLPNKVTSKLPSEVQPYLEKEMTNIEGKLEIRAALFKNAIGAIDDIQYVLNKNGTFYNLHFTSIPSTNLKTDAIINIKHAFLIPAGNNEWHLVVDPSDIVIVKDVKAMPYAFGPQKTLVLLLNFKDKPTDQPWTKDQITNLVFTDVNNVYYEQSFKQTTIVGQTAGYFTINLNSTDTCSNIQNQVPVLGNQAATDAGINLSQFSRRVYIFPGTTSCGWAGLGNVGGQVTSAWINGYATVKVIAHELGHNVGLYHSRAITCPNSPNEGTCTYSTYGDYTDIMGGGNTAHFNALQKDRLGWLNYQTSPPITTVTTSGNYFIDAYETHNNKSKALKILKSPTSTDYYYLEFRQGIGYDKELADCGTNCDYTKGIVFHQGSPTAGNSDLLDMTPGGSPQHVALLPCKSWTSGNITFGVSSVSTGGARVNITYGPQTHACTHAAPSLTYPIITPFAKEGERVLYTINIKNNDSLYCKSLDFAISPRNVSPLIKTMLSKNSLRIEPGKTKQFNLEVVPQKLPSGIYPIELLVKNGVDDKNSVSANLTLGVNKE